MGLVECWGKRPAETNWVSLPPHQLIFLGSLVLDLGRLGLGVEDARHGGHEALAFLCSMTGTVGHGGS